MSKEAPYRDRAEKTRKKIDRNQVSSSAEELPPRNKVHRQKRQKNKWKLKFPMIRLLVLFFILLPISIYSAYSYLNSQGEGLGGRIIKTTGGYERISLQEDEKEQLDHNHLENSPDKENKQTEEPVAPLKPSSLSTDVPVSVDGKGAFPSTQEQDRVASEKVLESSHPTTNGSDQEKLSHGDNEKLLSHTVTQGDNLFRISLKYYHSQDGMEIIKEANNLRDDEVQIGQVLIIPLEN